MSSEKVNSKTAWITAVISLFVVLATLYGYGYWRWNVIFKVETFTLDKSGELSPRFDPLLKLYESIDHQLPRSLCDSIFHPILAFGYEFHTIVVHRNHLVANEDFRLLGGHLFSSVESVDLISNWEEFSGLSEMGVFLGCKDLRLVDYPTFGTDEVWEIEHKFPNLQSLEIVARELDWESLSGVEIAAESKLLLGIVDEGLGKQPPDPQGELALERLSTLFPNLVHLGIQLEENAPFEKLANFPKLDRLWVSMSKVEPSFGNAISTIPSLTWVGVAGPRESTPITIDGIFSGPEAAGVTEVTFERVMVDWVSAETCLRKFPKAREIRFRDCTVPADFVRDLSDSNKLQVIRFSGILLEGGERYSMPPLYLTSPASPDPPTNPMHIDERDVKFSELDDLPGLLERLQVETK